MAIFSYCLLLLNALDVILFFRQVHLFISKNERGGEMKFTKKGLLLKTMAVVFVISLLTPFGIMKSYADTQTP